MSWRVVEPQGTTFRCDADRCPKTFTTPGRPLYEAFVDAKAAGWFMSLNEQLCPAHVKEES